MSDQYIQYRPIHSSRPSTKRDTRHVYGFMQRRALPATCFCYDFRKYFFLAAYKIILYVFNNYVKCALNKDEFLARVLLNIIAFFLKT